MSLRDKIDALAYDEEVDEMRGLQRAGLLTREHRVLLLIIDLVLATARRVKTLSDRGGGR